MPLHLWLQACRKEKSQGSLVSSRCNTTRRLLISGVSALPEDSRWLHRAHCHVSPPERTVRATVNAGSGLSPEGPKGTLLGDVIGEGGLNEKAASPRPLWRLTSSTRRSGKAQMGWRGLRSPCDRSLMQHLRVKLTLTVAAGTSNSMWWFEEPEDQASKSNCKTYQLLQFGH